MTQDELRERIEVLVKLRDNTLNELELLRKACKHPNLLDRALVGNPEVRHLCPDCLVVWYD